jgi:hypothetical protein
MKKSIANKWVKALRSGKYTQTKNNLTDGVGHCCLGVLCELYIKDTKDNIKDGTLYDDESEVLPQCVISWAGMQYKARFGDSYDACGAFTIDDKEICLASWNDGQSRPFIKNHKVVKGTFENIANVIEKYYDKI